MAYKNLAPGAYWDDSGWKYTCKLNDIIEEAAVMQLKSQKKLVWKSIYFHQKTIKMLNLAGTNSASFLA